MRMSFRALLLALIAAHDAGVWWAQALLYFAVATTIASGADYFLGFRRRIEEARVAREARGSSRLTA